MIHFNIKEVHAYKSRVLEWRKRQAQQKKRKEKEWGACKAGMLDRRKQEAKQKNSEATERGATRGLPRGHPS